MLAADADAKIVWNQTWALSLLTFLGSPRALRRISDIYDCLGMLFGFSDAPQTRHVSCSSPVLTGLFQERSAS